MPGRGQLGRMMPSCTTPAWCVDDSDKSEHAYHVILHVGISVSEQRVSGGLAQNHHHERTMTQNRSFWSILVRTAC